MIFTNNPEDDFRNLSQAIDELRSQIKRLEDTVIANNTALSGRLDAIEFKLKNGETAIKYVSATSGGPTTDEIQFIDGIFIQA